VVLQGRERASDDAAGLFRSTTFSGANLLTLALYFGLTGRAVLPALRADRPSRLQRRQGGRHPAAAVAGDGQPVRCRGAAWPTSFGARIMLTVGPIVAGAGFALLAGPWIVGWLLGRPLAGLLVLALGMTIASRR
jgi:hypothetical protein